MKHTWLGLVGTTLAGAVVGTVMEMVPTSDRLLTFALLFVVAVGLLGVLAWWVKEMVSEWWAIHDPNPVAPAQEPRYWPGSKADLEQKAAKEKAQPAEELA